MLREGEREVDTPLRTGECKTEPLPQRGPTGGGRGSNVLPRKGKHMLEALHREDERKLDTSPRGSPNEGKRGHRRKAPPRLDLTEVKLTTWNPGEGPAG